MRVFYHVDSGGRGIHACHVCHKLAAVNGGEFIKDAARSELIRTPQN